MYYSILNSLRPLNIEDQMIITKTRDASDGTSSVLTTVEGDEGKTL